MPAITRPRSPLLDTRLTTDAGIALPIIGGAMYPCSNPELVAAVSEAGAIGIVQPVSLTYVHGHDFREGLRLIRRLTSKPIGFNALIEAVSAEDVRRAADEMLSREMLVVIVGKPDNIAERPARS